MGETREERDARHWEAVEEAGELAIEGRLEESLVELKRVIEADPNNPYAFHRLGQVLWEVGQVAPARDAHRAAVLLAPDFSGARIALSHAHRKLGELDLAEREARVALHHAPKDGDAMYALGMALAARGQRLEARRHLEGFLGAGPEFEAQTEVRGILEMLGLGEEGDPLEVE